MVDVALHRGLADEKVVGDLGVGKAGGDQGQDFAFAGGEAEVAGQDLWVWSDGLGGRGWGAGARRGAGGRRGGRGGGGAGVALAYGVPGCGGAVAPGVAGPAWELGSGGAVAPGVAGPAWKLGSGG